MSFDDGKYIDCGKLRDVEVTLKINGVGLSVLHNALAVYQQFEPDNCDLCTDAFNKLSKMTQENMASMVKHLESHGIQVIHDKPADEGRPRV